MLGILLHGPVDSQWYRKERDLDFFDLKGIVESLCSSLGVEVRFVAANKPWLHPTRCAAVVVDEKKIGLLGEVSFEVAQTYDITHRALLAEVDLSQLIERAVNHPTVTTPPRFPAVLLDLSFSVPESISAHQILELVRESGGDLLENTRIFDVYRGEQVKEGKKSVAVSLTFRSDERTLTEEEAKRLRDDISQALETNFGGATRSR